MRNGLNDCVMWKEPFMVTNLKNNWSFEVPLSSMVRFSVFQLIVTLLFWFTLIASFPATGSCSVKRSDKTIGHYMPSTKGKLVAGEHRGAFNSQRARYFPQALVENKTVSQKHDSK